MTKLEELRKRLGLAPDQLLTNSAGETADLLGADETHARLGVLDTGRIISVPLIQLCPSMAEARKVERKLRKVKLHV